MLQVLRLRIWNQKIFTRGILKSDEVRELSPDTSGKLQTILVEEGDSVKKGDLLAVVDHEALTYDLKSKELQLLVDQKG